MQNVASVVMDKDQKKAVKAAAKIAKKRASAGWPAAATSPVPPGTGPSPAERSAEAAERQVALQRRRVWLAFLSLIVGLTAVALSLYGGGFFQSPTNGSPPALTQPAEAGANDAP